MYIYIYLFLYIYIYKYHDSNNVFFFTSEFGIYLGCEKNRPRKAAVVRALLLLGAWREVKSRRGETPEVPGGRAQEAQMMLFCCYLLSFYVSLCYITKFSMLFLYVIFMLHSSLRCST